MYDESNIVVNILISKDRNLYAETFSFVIFIKPSCKQTRTHSLSIVSRFTLVKQNIRICEEEFLNKAHYRGLYLRVIGGTLLAFIDYTKLISLFVFPYTLVLYEFNAILHSIVRNEFIRAIGIQPNNVWRMKIDSSEIKGQHNNSLLPGVTL